MVRGRSPTRPKSFQLATELRAGRTAAVKARTRNKLLVNKRLAELRKQELEEEQWRQFKASHPPVKPTPLPPYLLRFRALKDVASAGVAPATARVVSKRSEGKVTKLLSTR
jgi:CRISPR/Cas system Type II protein with McrA/HNH and RuvC-like nuclease domain